VAFRFVRALRPFAFAFTSPPFCSARALPFALWSFVLSVPVNVAVLKSDAFNLCESMKDLDAGAVVLFNH